MTSTFTRPGVYVQEVPLPASTAPTGNSLSSGALFGAAVEGPTEPVFITSWRQFTSVFNVSDISTPLERGVYQAFSNGATNMFVCRVVGSTAAKASIASGSQGNVPFLVRASSPGTWGNQISVTYTPIRDSENSDNATNILAWDVEVTRASTSGVYYPEKFTVLTTDANSSRYFVNILNDPSTGSAWIEAVAPTGALTIPSALTANTIANDFVTVTLTGGTDTAPVQADYTGAPAKFDAAEGALLMYCTDAAIKSTWTSAINAAVSNYCETRGNSFAILDTPAGLSPSAASQYGTDSTSYAAMYYPWLRIADPSRLAVAGSSLLVPPGSTVVGMILANDRAAGPWSAPAGVNMAVSGTVANTSLGVERTFTSSELDTLHGSSFPVNPIRPVPGQGITIMGARTQWTRDIGRYISVRRTLNIIKEELSRRAEVALFQPITPDLMETVKILLSNYLQSVLVRGGLAGNSEQQAFFVICDTSNNSASDIAQGRLNIDVGVALLTPAEFIVLRVGQFQGQTSVSEIA